jgi:SAM-dependent methyltransferase
LKIDNKINDTFEYNGSYYEEIGDFLKENYLEYGFTKGTKQEVDFLVEIMDIPQNSRILDIGCGPGRHSLEFARRGYNSVGVDISSEFIKYANQVAKDEKLKAEFFVADARELNFNQEFDGAICLCEGAFGLAGNEDNHRKVLKSVYNALRPGSLFVLTVINALSVARSITDNCEFDIYTCTKVDKDTITSPEGETKDVKIYTTAFTFRELKFLLESEGFEVETAYGCSASDFSEKLLTINDIEIMMIARRK